MSLLDNLTDVAYEIEDGLATITINRPDRFNSFRSRTVDELIACFKNAWSSPEVGVVCLTGAGDRAFSTGGDQKQRAETGDYGPSETGVFEVDHLQQTVRNIPKPVIAAVNGFAIGGGHVLALLCDLTIASDNAKFGQVGPKVGSFDAGFGTAYMARVVGEKRAQEIWFLCRQYDAQQALDWGLANTVVPQAELKAEVRKWADEMLVLSPTALKVLKHSMNADTESHFGLSKMAFASLELFTGTDEAKEGYKAFNEKRAPDFSPYRAT